jgi:hypothetical protein
MGQAAAALVGVAAARAKQVAEQLLTSRDKARDEAMRRGGGFVEEGRHAAADVVAALRRETSVILRDLEHLEQTLRSREGGHGPGPTTAAGAPELGQPAPATKRPATKRPATKRPAKSSGPAKSATAGKAATSKASATKATKQTASRAKAAEGRTAAGPRKTTGGSRRPPGEEQG